MNLTPFLDVCQLSNRSVNKSSHWLFGYGSAHHGEYPMAAFHADSLASDISNAFGHKNAKIKDGGGAGTGPVSLL